MTRDVMRRQHDGGMAAWAEPGVDCFLLFRFCLAWIVWCFQLE